MTTKMTCGDKIAEALFDAITSNSDADLTNLYSAIDEFRTKYPTSYDAVRKQPFARKLLDAIAEANQWHLNALG